MLERILYACAAAVFTGLTPVFIRTGAKRGAPAVCALVYALVALLFSAGVAAMSGAFAPLAAVLSDARALVCVILAGLCTGGMCLSLFCALSQGMLLRVSPIAQLSTVLAFGVSALFFDGRVGIWRLCFIVLILLGALLVESGQPKAKSALWLLFALLAAFFSAASDALLSFGAPALDHWTATLFRVSVAFVSLLLFAVAGRAFRALRETPFAAWLFSVLAGLGTGLAWLSRFYGEQLGDWSELAPIGCAAILVTALFARVCAKERLSGATLLGLALIVLGNFALLMNL